MVNIVNSWPEIGGHSNSFTNRTTGSTHFIELLTNHGFGTGVQGMTTAANITKSDTKFANSDFFSK